MAGSKTFRKKRQQGVIDTLASGALRVRVDAGVDPVTKRRHRRTRIIPAERADKEAEAEKVRIQLLNELYERRNPRTEAKVSQLMERYLDDFEGAWSTVENYQRLWQKHVEPFIGNEKVGDVDVEMLESLYRELRRCREHCTRRFVAHRTSRQHECDHRCRQHECTPLGTSARRQIHWLLSGAFRSAVRWKWVTENPVQDTKAVPPPVPKPQPPTPTQAAAIVNAAAARDTDWATLIWLAMTTGARRHELCALRWTDLVTEDDTTVLWIRRGISKDQNGNWAEQDTKDHQQRPVTLDPETVAVLREHHDRCERDCAELQPTAASGLAKDALLFSPTVDYSRFYTPGAITQRFDTMVSRLDIDTTFHKLRHYSATELIKGGVDINTVSGRLGHGGGGATTLKVYTAFLSEADQRAAGAIGARMPERNWDSEKDPIERAKSSPQTPYEIIAAKVRRDILDGVLADGEPAPTMNTLAERHGVSPGTVNRALALLRTWGLVSETSRGRRAWILGPAEMGTGSEETNMTATAASASNSGNAEKAWLDLRLLHLGSVVRTFKAQAVPDDPEQIQQLLQGAARRHSGGEGALADYELEVRRAGVTELFSTFAGL